MTSSLHPSQIALELFTPCIDCIPKLSWKLWCKRCLVRLERFDLARQESLRIQAKDSKELEHLNIRLSLHNLSTREMARVTKEDLLKPRVTVVNENIEADELMKLIMERKLR